MELALSPHENLERSKNDLVRAKKSKPSLFRYAPVFLVALLKDLLDFTVIGLLPIVTICFSILIFLLLLLIGTGSELRGGATRSMIRRGIVLLFGTLVEALGFGLNFFPIETAVVYVIYTLDRRMSNRQIKDLSKAVDEITKKLPRHIRSQKQKYARNNRT